MKLRLKAKGLKGKKAYLKAEEAWKAYCEAVDIIKDSGMLY